jgi:hypothetical protein
MSHSLLTDARFFNFIEEIDEDTLATAGRGACPHCGDRLDRADFPRKPKGDPRTDCANLAVRRKSFCCRRDGCRRRVTPPQLRFLGRRCYLAAVVVLAAAILNGPTPPRIAAVARSVGAAKSTVTRWLAWWRDSFPVSPLWRERRARLAQPVDEVSLPASLLAVFVAASAATGDAIGALLRFLLP